MSIRIISGTNRGKKLMTLQGMNTRPTTDRTREALFNILSRKVRGAYVLDLFAGTGAIGIEALSRGAEYAVFIDNYRPAINIIKKNIASCRLAAKSRIIFWDIAKDLNCLAESLPKFNIVFMDPPYNSGMVGATLSNLQTCDALDHNAIVVVEHSSSESLDTNKITFEILDQRRYGKTQFTFLTYKN